MLSKEYKYLDSKVIELINKSISNYPTFDENQFKAWIERNEIESKVNPSAFVSKCFVKELNKGTFDKSDKPTTTYVPATQPFFNYLKEKGIEVIPDDTALIDETFRYLLENEILSRDELSKLNHDIVEYMLKQESGHTSQEFINLMTKSNTLKGRYIDWSEITDRANQVNKKWKELLEDLSENENKEEPVNFWDEKK